MAEKIGQLRDRIADLTTLEVQTFTGQLSEAIIDQTPADGDKGGSILNWTALLKAAKSNVRGEVFLAAASYVQVAGDTDTFIATDIDPKILQAHDAAVKAAQEMRRGIVTMFREFLDGIRDN